jgi:hypothetical protein
MNRGGDEITVEDDLLRLARDGVAGFPPAQFGGLVAECRGAAEQRLGLRFLPIAEAVDVLREAWEPYEAFWTKTTALLDSVLGADLPLILTEGSEEAAVYLAKSMYDALKLIILSADEM